MDPMSMEKLRAMEEEMNRFEEEISFQPQSDSFGYEDPQQPMYGAPLHHVLLGGGAVTSNALPITTNAPVHYASAGISNLHFLPHQLQGRGGGGHHGAPLPSALSGDALSGGGGAASGGGGTTSNTVGEVYLSYGGNTVAVPVQPTPAVIQKAPAVYATPLLKTKANAAPPTLATPTTLSTAPSLLRTQHHLVASKAGVVKGAKPESTPSGVGQSSSSAIAFTAKNLTSSEDFAGGGGGGAHKLRKEQRRKKYIRTAGGQNWEDPSLLEWESDDFRIFCGDLGNDVTDEVLSRAFGKFPSFIKAKVIRDKRNNKTKGFGFVSFRDPQDFIRAMKEMNGKYVGSRPIKLRKSTWKDRNLEIVKKKMKEKQRLGLR